MTRIPIVDENDVEVAIKDKSEVQLDDIYRVSVLWITNRKGEVLMAKRALTKTHDPGCWGPAVAGTVDEGETYEINIVKEAFEEIGLKVTVNDLEKGPKLFSQGKYKHFSQWYFYKAHQPIEMFTVQAEEVAEIRYFTPAELMEEFRRDPKQFVQSARRFLPLLLGQPTSSFL